MTEQVERLTRYYDGSASWGYHHTTLIKNEEIKEKKPFYARAQILKH